MLEKLQQLISQMCKLEKSGQYAPILEADVAALLYHLLVAESACPLNKVHVDTRVLGAGKNDRYDLVIGKVVVRMDRRPAVSPEAVIEIKMFPTGFSGPQHRVHFEHVLNDDLGKLGFLETPTPMRAQLLFDQVNYLGGKYSGRNREDVIAKKRDEVAKGANIISVRKIGGDWRVSLR